MNTHVGDRLPAFALLGVVVLTVASCGQQPAVCTEAEELRASVRQLQNTSLRENGLGSLTTSLTEVRTQLSQFTAAAKDHFKPQTDAVRAAVDQVQGSAAAAKATPSAPAFGQVGVSLGSLQSAVENLANAVRSTC